MSLASVAYREVQGIVETWTKKYQYHISLLETKPNQVKFMVQFSLPQPQKPIPIATIRVYFTCTNHQQLKITFRFEKDSLIHLPNKTIRQQEIQKWIDDSLAKKLLVRETVFYLGTAYESTRVKDVRQDNILREVPKIEEAEYVYIHPDLLADQQRFIEIMERGRVSRKVVEGELKKYFGEVDKESIGVITHPEFIQLVKNINIRLNPLQEKELLKKVDPQESGMVQYQLYRTVIGQFIEGIQAKKQAQARLTTNQQQQTFGSILMLINDQSQDIGQTLITKFKTRDQDQTGLTNISQVKAVLDEIVKKIRQQNKPQPLSVVELSQIAKILTDTYGYKDIPYANIHSHIIAYKIKQLANGRISSRMTLLQTHLRQIFEKYDEKKLGKIKVDHFEEALAKSEKIKLTKAHVYLLKSFLVIDVKNQVNYLDNSKFLAELIKKFYLNSSKQKQ